MSGPTGGGRHHHDDPPPARWTAPDETGEWVRPGPGDSGVHDFGPAPGGRRRRHSYDDEVAGHDDRPAYDDRLDDRRSIGTKTGSASAWRSIRSPIPRRTTTSTSCRATGRTTAGRATGQTTACRATGRTTACRGIASTARRATVAPLRRARSRDRSDDRLPRDRFDGPSRDGFDGSPPFDRITDPPSYDRQRPAPVEGRSSFGRHHESVGGHSEPVGGHSESGGGRRRRADDTGEYGGRRRAADSADTGQWDRMTDTGQYVRTATRASGTG